MGRSFSTVTPARVQAMQLPASVYSAKLDRHYEVFSRAGKLFQSEYQTSADGQEIFRNTHEVKWLIGAGTNGFNGIVQRDRFMFETPMAFYTTSKKWDLSPGYELEDLGFNRAIVKRCITCHSGQPGPGEKGAEASDFAPAGQTPIGCENCHGPGAVHVRTMSTHSASAHGKGIVNPDRLSADLENEICMSCHESGDSSVPMPGKSFRDFRPGTPLADTLSILMVPPSRTGNNEGDHVQYSFEMSMSMCFRASAGQLRCATCHDPHVEPTHDEAPEWFNARCMQCHASRTCTAPLESRHQTKPADNCIACHMPRRPEAQIAHLSLTNHRILMQPGEPWPDSAFQLTTSSLPDLVYLDRPPGHTDDPPKISLLAAYREIADRRPEYRSAYLKTLSELDQAEPENAVVQMELGHRDLDDGAFDQAIGHLQHSIQLDPNQAKSYAYLSEAQAQRERLAEAIAASEKAVSLDPYDELFQKALIDRLIAAKQYDKALAAMEHYMDAFPEDGEMRRMLDFIRK
jgi:hypothetical protein